MTRLWPAVAVAMAASGAAQAHTFGAAGAGLAEGLGHPLSGLDHVLAMVAVGLWAAQIGGRKALWLVPAAFVAMMALGGLVGLQVPDLPAVEFGILGSLVVLGSLVALSVRAKVWAGAAIVGFFALFHGHAHGAEMIEAASSILYGLGFMLTTASLHGLGIAAGLCLRSRAGWLVRAGGAGIAAAGIALAVIA
ncbi:MAG: HupE/UreJ family protein [Pseudomonadota bacterium]